MQKDKNKNKKKQTKNLILLEFLTSTCHHLTSKAYHCVGQYEIGISTK